MKLILTGGGDSHNFHEIDQKFMSLLSERARLLFIPLAGDPDAWPNGLERVARTFSTIHFDDIEMCLELSELAWEYLRQFDAIYFDGGNTFQLMYEIHHTHTYEMLHRFLNHGGVINGDSAGAIVLGSHIETAHFGGQGDENEAGVISYQGLNLLGKWAIHCHYNQEEDEEIMDFVQDFGFPVLALHEETSVYIEEDLFTVYGEAPATIFYHDHIHIVLPGETYQLI